jgi:hypothetical protein
MKAVAILAAVLAVLVLPAAAQPPQPSYSTDPDKCTWSWKTGTGLGAWTERCAMNGVWEPVFRPGVPELALTVGGDDAGTVLQLFQKPADGDISAILPELRKRGYIPDDNDCVFQPASQDAGLPAKGQAFFEIMPTGARKAAFDATPADEVPDPPCGEYGFDPDGLRYFVTDSAHPAAVLYMNLGQDGTLFDPATVTVGD